MEKALIGALLAGAAGVWALVIIKLVQQRTARNRRRQPRSADHVRMPRPDAQPRPDAEVPSGRPAHSAVGWERLVGVPDPAPATSASEDPA